jgi:hypothetical protein
MLTINRNSGRVSFKIYNYSLNETDLVGNDQEGLGETYTTI